jgi:hypothetical protein
VTHPHPRSRFAGDPAISMFEPRWRFRPCEERPDCEDGNCATSLWPHFIASGAVPASWTGARRHTLVAAVVSTVVPALPLDDDPQPG